MDRLEESRERRFLDRLRHGRVGMASARQILRRTAELHKYRSLVDHLAGAETDDMGAQHTVARLVGEDLHESVGLEHGAGTAVGRKREFSDLVIDAGLL